jgi:hypothetical protein
MIRITYNPTTGMIETVVPVAHAIDEGTYIDYSNSINVNEYRVNVLTKELERLPDDEIPQIIRR